LDLNSKSPTTFNQLQRTWRNMRRAAAFLARNHGLAWLRSSRVDQFLTATLVATASPGIANATDWSTTSHMAYATTRESSTGFEKVGGTMAYFDVARRLGPSVDFGLRTLAQGARSDALEFYRLGSGPFVGWSPATGWRLEAGVGFFRESGLAPDGQKIYTSQGRAWTLGWERSQTLFTKVDWAYGGFLMAHRGSLALAEQPSPAHLGRLSQQRNDGLSQGVQLALRIRLD
jgi:hypothetical protein